MKTFPAGLDTLLDTGSFVFADLYKFSLSDGATFLYYTTADTDVLYGGNTYTSKGPFFESIASRSRGHWKAGLDLDEWTVTIMPAVADSIFTAATIYSQPWLSAVRAGALDGATVDVHRAYWSAWPVPWASPLVPSYVLVDVFAGRVANIDLDRTRATITINSHIEMLSRPMPRNVYSSSCRHTLFDTGCSLSRASFSAAGTVGTVTNNGSFQTNLAQALDYFSLGYLTWLTGANVGFSKTIRSYAGGGVSAGAIVLIAPMPFTVVSGDTFTAYAGCDKSMTTCDTKFGNKLNYGGTPYIPVPETAI